MTRKDYIVIAGSLLAARPIDPPHMGGYEKGAHEAVDAAALNLAASLAADNPRFDRARFLRACGVAE